MQAFNTIQDFEKYAAERLAKPARDYYFSGANAMKTLNATRAVFDKIKLKRAAEVDVTKFMGI